MDDLAKQIWDQVLLVQKAPVPFIGGVLLCGGVAWRWAKHTYSSRLDDANSKIDLLKERVAEYERKLSGASPDEARERITKLEASLAAMPPRGPLTIGVWVTLPGIARAEMDGEGRATIEIEDRQRRVRSIDYLVNGAAPEYPFGSGDRRVRLVSADGTATVEIV